MFVKHKEHSMFSTHFKHLSVLFIACLLVYSNVFKNGFSQYDDPEEIVQNTALTNTTLSGAVKLFTNPVIYGFYAPVKNLVHMLNYFLTGDFNPVMFHAVNAILHILTVFCCYIFLLLLTKKRQFAFVTSLLFAVHPCHSQPVNGCSARSLLAGMFSFLCLIFYLLYEREKAKQAGKTLWEQLTTAGVYYAFSLISFSLGIFSHPMAITLPAVIFIYQAAVADTGDTIYRRILRSAVKVAPFAAVSLFYIVISFYYFHPVTQMSRVTKTYHSKWVYEDAGLMEGYLINSVYAVNRDHNDSARLPAYETFISLTGLALFVWLGFWKQKENRWKILAPAIFLSAWRQAFLWSTATQT